MPTGDGLRAREAQFASRVVRLLGLDQARAYVAHVTVDEPAGQRPTLRVDVVMRLTTEEAWRLRYGDDADVERKPDGTLIITIPEKETPRA